MTVPTKTMFLQVGRKRYQIASFQEASEKFCVVRDASGLGASKTPTPLIVGEQGETVGYVAYNGRIFPGTPGSWKPGTQPLYDNR